MAFRFLTSGESHGPCLTAIVEGIPAGFAIEEDYINNHLARRQQGYGRGGRMKIEKDTANITAGVRHGFSTGAPICLVVNNRDWANWQVPMSSQPVDLSDREIAELVLQKKITHVRPGHADLPGAIKYNQQDVRNILERSSARETAARVAVGGLARNILKKFGIEIFSHLVSLGGVEADTSGMSYTEIKEWAESSELRCADVAATVKMKDAIDKAALEGDTLGGVFEVIALNLPIGLGSHVHWDRRLDGRLAQSVMSIPAIKSVSFGAGELCGSMSGSETHDEIFQKNGGTTYTRKTNNAGGVEGGMTNGMPLVVKAAMKAIPTMKKPLMSIDLETGAEHVAHYERSDVCASPAAAVVAEAMVAITLLDAFLEKFGGDSLQEIQLNYDNYIKMCEKR